MAETALSPELRDAVDCYMGTDWHEKDAREVALATVVEALAAKQVQLLDIVVHLQGKIGNPNIPSERRQSVQLLADCLKSQAQLRLNFKHVETLSNFFCSKLGDWQCVEGAAEGLLVLLVRYGPVLRTLNAEDGEEPFVTSIARSLFKDVHAPSHTQQVRKAVLDLARTLMVEWRAEVEALGAALGEGVSSTVEEERDPRNLLQSFAVCRLLLGECAPACVSDQTLVTLFESLTSYFPITFTPPKNDKFGITGEDLRHALSCAISATPRLAQHAVPFLLDASKDAVTGSDDDATDTISQALETVSFCLETYGPQVALKHVKDVLDTARDQVCRTTTPCAAEFAEATRRSLAAAFRDVPSGLHPNWLARKIDPAVKALAEDAAREGSDVSLARSGARRLLLAAAAAHPVLLEQVWTFTVPLLLASPSTATAGTSPGPEAGEASGQAPMPLPLGALPFMLELVRLAEGHTGASPLLTLRQLRPALDGALRALRDLRPGSAAAADEWLDAPAVAFALAGHLCRLAGESASGETFAALRLALLPPGKQEGGDAEPWAAEWRQELSGALADNARVAALATAVGGVAAEQPARAAELAPVLLAATAEAALAWWPTVLPRLLAAAALSLARRAAQAPSDNQAGSEAAAEADRQSSRELLQRAASLVWQPEKAGTKGSIDAIGALAEALEATSAPAAAVSWAASQLAAAMNLPQDLQRLCGDGGDAASATLRAAAARRLVGALGSRLPPLEASALRRSAVEAVVSAAAANGSGASGGRLAVIALVPAVLPSFAKEDWALCRGVLPVVRLCASAPEFATLEPLALEALEALVEVCPDAESEALLQHFHEAFGQVLLGDAGQSVEPHGARGAARCWAAAAGALLRRGGAAQQAATFLEALLAVLKAAPVARFVPVAFQVLAPPRFDGSGGSGGSQVAAGRQKLPPLALQQLSRTTLPLLVAHTKDVPTDAPAAKRAALESAVSLLCALPVEVACGDCGEELQWCILAGMGRLQKESAAPAEASEAGGSLEVTAEMVTFAAQVLQLLVRAIGQSAAWVEDNLEALVPVLALLAPSHRVPLVRLSCLQALQMLVQQSRGHLAPFKKQIEAATRLAVGDHRREVRLVAVACLNTWHCAQSAAS